MNKRALALTICLLLFGAGWAFGQQARFTRAGQGWKTLNDLDRVLYVNGYSSGYKDAVRDVQVLTGILPLEEMKAVWGDGMPVVPGVLYVPVPGHFAVPEVRDLRLHVAVGLVEDGPSGYITSGQISNTVSSLYVDFRNQPICWQSAIHLAKKSLIGISPSDEELARLRTWGARTGCD